MGASSSSSYSITSATSNHDDSHFPILSNELIERIMVTSIAEGGLKQISACARTCKWMHAVFRGETLDETPRVLWHAFMIFPVECLENRILVFERIALYLAMGKRYRVSLPQTLDVEAKKAVYETIVAAAMTLKRDKISDADIFAVTSRVRHISDYEAVMNELEPLDEEDSFDVVLRVAMVRSVWNFSEKRIERAFPPVYGRIVQPNQQDPERARIESLPEFAGMNWDDICAILVKKDIDRVLKKWPKSAPRRAPEDADRLPMPRLFLVAARILYIIRRPRLLFIPRMESSLFVLLDVWETIHKAEALMVDYDGCGCLADTAYSNMPLAVYRSYQRLWKEDLPSFAKDDIRKAQMRVLERTVKRCEKGDVCSLCFDCNIVDDKLSSPLSTPSHTKFVRDHVYSTMYS